MSAPYQGTPFDLSGKTVFLAGAAGFLGQEFARAVASAGARVVLADQDENRLTQIAASVRETAPRAELMTAAFNITDETSVTQCVNRVVERFGTIDVLVNSAAIDAKFDPGADTSRFTQFTQFPREQWDLSLEVNLTGLFLLTQRVCQVMEKKGEGSIINIGSNYGMVGPDQRIYRQAGKSSQSFKPPVYSVCKAGVLGFTAYLAAYYAGTKIRVNTLTPAGVFNNHSPEFEKNYADRTILRRMSQKDEYWGAVIFLASNASSYMTGSNLVIDGGWTAL